MRCMPPAPPARDNSAQDAARLCLCIKQVPFCYLDGDMLRGNASKPVNSGCMKRVTEDRRREPKPQQGQRLQLVARFGADMSANPPSCKHQPSTCGLPRANASIAAMEAQTLWRAATPGCLYVDVHAHGCRRLHLMRQKNRCKEHRPLHTMQSLCSRGRTTHQPAAVHGWGHCTHTDGRLRHSTLTDPGRCLCSAGRRRERGAQQEARG